MKFEGKIEGREYRPRPARVAVRYDALVQLDGSAIEAQILNVSNLGFRLRTRSGLEPGAKVTLQVPRLEPVRGIIRWTCGDESGGVFMEAVAL